MISKRRRNVLFLEAFILTITIYLFAVVGNQFLDDRREAFIDNEIQNFQIISDSALASSFFYSNIGIENCERFGEQIFNQQELLKEIGADISNYGKLFLDRNENLSLLNQRKFFLDELLLYSQVQEYNKICLNETIVPVLYFFNGKSNLLDEQALILEQFFLNHKNKTIIFSFDINYEDEPLLNLVKQNYNVSFVPFLIIGNETTRSLVGRGVIGLNRLTVEYINQGGRA